MSIGGFDPEILQDFLTESGELLDQLEGDLVTLEHTPTDPALLNQVFRALHTIKGSASFLALTNLVRIAHASESALNAARNGQVRVERAVMDLLLQAVDILKRQMDQIRAGVELEEPPAELVRVLTEVGEGRAPAAASGAAPSACAPASVETRELQSSAQPSTATAATVASAAVGAGLGGVRTETPCKLGSGKADLLEFLVNDLDETLDRVDAALAQWEAPATSHAAAAALLEETEALFKAVDFLSLEPLTVHATALRDLGHAAADLEAAAIEPIVARARALTQMLREQGAALPRKTLLTFESTALLERFHALLEHQPPAPGDRFAPGTPLEQILSAAPAGAAQHAGPVADHSEEVTAAFLDPTPTSATTADPAPTPQAASSTAAPAVTPAPVAPSSAASPANAPVGGDKAGEKAHSDKAADQTIRVEVSRLEALMNLVGELVLQKNRVLALTRKVQQDATVDQQLKEAVGAGAGGLDRVTSDIQLAVMRTRMQPLDKLFGKYPRLIRDLARKTGKQIELVVEGGETEVDKSVIEELGDPLVHLMRNSADHGIEMPEVRTASGKSPGGTIRLAASHEGSHVRVTVADDGKGLVREKLAKKAVERQLVREADLASLSDREVFNFIFLPGFSTADQVSDLSGRGVGMDVVRTNIEKIKGNIELSSKPGAGTTITITIPLTVAIMQAMMVGVGNEIYAVPLSSILEIVKPGAAQSSTIGEHPVMRLRDSVLPLVSAADIFDCGGAERPPTPFAVVLQSAEKRLGLMVTRLIGQQEIVIKPLEAGTGAGAERKGAPRGPISGATVRDDGGVSLIVDVAELLRRAERQHQRKVPKAA